MHAINRTQHTWKPHAFPICSRRLMSLFFGLLKYSFLNISFTPFTKVSKHSITVHSEILRTHWHYRQVICMPVYELLQCTSTMVKDPFYLLHRISFGNGSWLLRVQFKGIAASTFETFIKKSLYVYTEFSKK